MRKLPDRGPAGPAFTVEFNIYLGADNPELDHVIIKVSGDDSHFPWAELGLLSDRRDGYEPSDYGEIEADRGIARSIARKLKASGFAVASHCKVACE